MYAKFIPADFRVKLNIVIQVKSCILLEWDRRLKNITGEK